MTAFTGEFAEQCERPGRGPPQRGHFHGGQPGNRRPRLSFPAAVDSGEAGAFPASACTSGVTIARPRSEVTLTLARWVAWRNYAECGRRINRGS
jgi:hypothetical protein